MKQYPRDVLRVLSRPTISPTLPLLLILILIGFALRCWFLSLNEIDPTFSPADDGDYYQRARRFATTGEYIDDFWLIRPPLHVFLFAFLLRLSIILGNIDGLWLIRVVQIIMIVLTIPIGYGFARRLFGRRAGLIFAGFLAIWYPLVELPVHLFSEPSFFFFLILHGWLLVVWRDTRRWPFLAAAGVALGFASLARSPTIYGLPFVVIWLLLDATGPAFPASIRAAWHDIWNQRRLVAQSVALFVGACLLVVLPWTVRNYLVYERVILIDTIGPVNLWLHIEQYPEKGVEILKTMPQGERQPFAVGDTMRIAKEDPVAFWQLLWRNAWPHFRHVWKAQFIEDLATKRSFYGRPIHETIPLGIVGDLLWFLIMGGGMVALATPLCEGWFRVVALLWLLYTIVAMMIMHIEPRYLLPVWLFLGLYGAWFWSSPRSIIHHIRQHRLTTMLALVLGGGFLVLVFTYRDYPALLHTGLMREWHRAIARDAYQAGDTETAIQSLQEAITLHRGFVDSHAELALVLTAAGDLDAAAAELAGRSSQRADLARGALALAQNNHEEAARAFAAAERRAGDNLQRLAKIWLHVPPTALVDVGGGADLGYLDGFSVGETAGQNTLDYQSYRWLQGRGHITLPLSQSLVAGNTVSLLMTSGRPEATTVCMQLRGTTAVAPPVTFAVGGGQWRVYELLIPAPLHGESMLEIWLDSPIFIPAHFDRTSNDLRPVSLMVGKVWVQ